MIYTVTQLTTHLQHLIEQDPLLGDIQVSGEISNCKPAASGHLYFTLKDANSCLKAVMFRSRAGRLTFRPADGMAVIARGYIAVYGPGGTYQLYVQDMLPAGQGNLYAAFLQLKEKLAREGLFDQQYKKPLPPIPACVALITSPRGAVLRDMVQIMRRRWPLCRLVLVPVTVQGQTAPGEIVQAIHQVDSWGGAQVIILARGGGSLEDLWAFNSEEVARAIFACRTPLVSAVGHETDYTIADFVADLRAPTPSAAAELVVPDQQEVRARLDLLRARAERVLRQQLANWRARLEASQKRPLFQRPVDVICGQRALYLDKLRHQLSTAWERKEQAGRRALGELLARLDALSPLATLARGYAICLDGRGMPVRNSSQVRPQEQVEIRLHRGRLFCQVERVE
ncbi:exodeoxyribonuclease VII large subunit [Desulfurispora thermophila]|uniref:exodeoxyribonuclease VII large subunit n=1 Tax=Desulfurispora thermophila TaxID=265470 RepID=UPI00036D22DA|nr:exodeoxyribonuclease VII large subunit [Desulfurispora thermophila]